jgi:hypothetical protein
MALDAAGDRRRTTFDTQTKNIFCVGELASGRADVTVSARIRAPLLLDRTSGQMVAADLTMGVGEVAPGKGERTIVSFELQTPSDPTMGSIPQAYIPGSYVCELSIDGHLEEAVPFSIVYAECPKEPPLNEAPCAGWVRPGANCQGISPRIACNCGGEGLWSCAP